MEFQINEFLNVEVFKKGSKCTAHPWASRSYVAMTCHKGQPTPFKVQNLWMDNFKLYKHASL